MPGRVHILPLISEEDDPGHGGIHRVIVGQRQTLPAFGWEVVDDPARADVIACHVEIPPAYMRLYPGKPFVVHNHGLYWTDGGYPWEQWCYATNQKALAAVRAASAVSAVSEWTAQALRRNTLRDVRVIWHGVDLDEWTPPEEPHGGYVVWNKTRIDPICDPEPMQAAAALLPRVRFVSTFGKETANVEITGKVTYAVGKEMVRRAAVYLATTRETFGIGTLEALAAGVPVVGYDFGGQVEIIDHGVDGWLARPGDTEGLAEGIEWALAHRDEVSARARAKAEQFPVARSGEQYAALYDEVLERSLRERAAPRVSVVVPVYKMGDYLDDTLRSVAAQEMADWECIVVNDASPDERDHEITQRYVEADPRFREIVLAQNGYLANARNVGIEAARGRYIFPLDADDQLAPGALATLADALDSDPSLHVSYGNVYFAQEDGQTPIVYADGQARGLPPGHSGWPIQFNLEWMLRGPGQLLPYASMFRRTVWEQTAGYRTRSRSSEDQDFWLRATSYGFTARMVTNADTLIYRVRPDSMSSPAGEGWEDHRGWFPWCADRSLVPAGAIQDGKPVEDLPMPALDPVGVAVVIPVGPGHARYVIDAVDSVDAQTFRNWECIVVNDTGEPLPPLPSWVRVIEEIEYDEDWVTSPEHPVSIVRYGRYGGAAAARNAGIRASRAPILLPLDADDNLQPRAIELMWENAVSSREPAVIYSDFWEDPDRIGEFRVYQCPDYDPWALTKRGALHAVTALTPRRFWEGVGGYSETLPWEDWAFAISIAAKGWCSRRIALPLFTYRKHTGMRRNQNVADFEDSKRAMMAADFGMTQGGELLACSSCGSGRASTSFGGFPPPQQGAQRLAPPEDAVLLRYTGPREGTFRFRSNVNRAVTYAFSTVLNEGYVHKDDAVDLLRRTDFEQVSTQDIARAEDVASTPPLVAARTPIAEDAAAAPSGNAGWAPDASHGGAAVMERPEAAAAPAPPPPVAPSEQLPPRRPAEPSEQARALAEQHDREALNQMAAAEGLSGHEALRTKAEVAQLIITKRNIARE